MLNPHDSVHSIIVHLAVCEYYVHVDCHDLAVSDCKEAATYVPNLDKVCLSFLQPLGVAHEKSRCNIVIF